MEQLDLAIQYLKNRAVSTRKVKNKLIKQYIKVLPLGEVESVLDMVKTGEFINFYNRMKELGLKECIEK